MNRVNKQRGSSCYNRQNFIKKRNWFNRGLYFSLLSLLMGWFILFRITRSYCTCIPFHPLFSLMLHHIFPLYLTNERINLQKIVCPTWQYMWRITGLFTTYRLPWGLNDCGDDYTQRVGRCALQLSQRLLGTWPFFIFILFLRNIYDNGLWDIH